jgi:RHH-type proline utilization regulon transcriptional repressor/proline dehydrogenase/delta 1-pyrroline-5-carboxylate dehydrogenase
MWAPPFADPRVAGVAFTGSTAVARAINRVLAGKDGPIVPLIAETGGINPMIVDATALPEQVADDVVTSAFRSAGQRCSALRLLCVQEDVAERILEMVEGAARELALGDPRDPATHVGPVIDVEARDKLERWIAKCRRGRLRFRGITSQRCWRRDLCGACDRRFERAGDLTEEVSGPSCMWCAGAPISRRAARCDRGQPLLSHARHPLAHRPDRRPHAARLAHGMSMSTAT